MPWEAIKHKSEIKEIFPQRNRQRRIFKHDGFENLTPGGKNEISNSAL